MAKLTPKQKKFCLEYLKDLNATQAAIRAGYSKRTARATGSDNMTKPAVAAEIARRQGQRVERTEVTVDMVVNELAKMAFSNMNDYLQLDEEGFSRVNLADLTRDQFAAVQEIITEEGPGGITRVKFKLADKKGNLDLLAKHLGMFTDKHEISGPGGGPLDTSWKITIVDAG